MLAKILSVLIFIPTLVFADAGERISAENYILVSGTGSASAAPDMATVTIGISATNSSAKNAMEEISIQSKKLLSVAKQFNLEDKEIQTSNLSLGQDYNSQKAPQYVASSMVTVTMRNLSVVGDFIGSAVEGGANNVSSIQFGVSNSQLVLGNARESAFRDAEAKAQQLALLSGRQLGKVLSIDESGGEASFPRPQFKSAAMQMSAPAISPGELQFNATVNVKFELQP